MERLWKHLVSLCCSCLHARVYYQLWFCSSVMARVIVQMSNAVCLCMHKNHSLPKQSSTSESEIQLCSQTVACLVAKQRENDVTMYVNGYVWTDCVYCNSTHSNTAIEIQWHVQALNEHGLGLRKHVWYGQRQQLLFKHTDSRNGKYRIHALSMTW